MINLAFLWHMHQPFYRDLLSGKYTLPWVRLHATKDYYDMVAILDRFPKIKLNFNLVPSLLIQLEDYASGKVTDQFLELTLKPAKELTEDEKIFILHNFFMANWDNMIKPYPRYRELLEKRGRRTVLKELKRIQIYFREQDYRDLQVWFNLSWTDPYWQKNDSLVKELISKGKNFIEEEKIGLIAKQQEICGKIIKKYKEVQERGQIEITVSPFYHPVLPLLYDLEIAKKSSPQIKLPQEKFQHPEDAQLQVERAITFYEKVFGKKPQGLWPPEGTVCEEIIPLIASSGIKWLATDEEILFRSLKERPKTRQSLYSAYQIEKEGGEVSLVFRDHILSDLIGFVYYRWNAQEAVKDFLKRLQSIDEQTRHLPSEHLVTVILDGENCWEFYPHDGEEFLNELYQAISENPNLKTVTISEYLEKNPPRETLPKLWPGSWINANFNIWTGHSEDQIAWGYLAKTRETLTNYLKENPQADTHLAWESIYIAEGSDWFWWYGDEFCCLQEEIFDSLYRKHLMNVYQVIGEKTPDWLHLAIKGREKRKPLTEPVDLISPEIDGKITSYFEWRAAGFYQAGHSGGTMHQAESIIQSFHYGFDWENLYLRLDTQVTLNQLISSELIGEERVFFKIVFLQPTNCEARLNLEKNQGELFCIHEENLLSLGTFPLVADKVIELSIPFKLLETNEMQLLLHHPETTSQQETPTQLPIEFVLVVERGGIEIERWPYQGSVTLKKPTRDYLLQTWTV